MIDYYQKRAKEYEAIYQKSERQKDLRALKKWVKETFKQQKVLEIACGTGYWTTHIAESAKAITALDINSAVIEIAQTKQYSADVLFLIEDLEKYQSANKFDALFGGFICSHILLQDFRSFIENCLTHITKNGQLIFMDNRYVHGSNTPISRTDDQGNTYQRRLLKSGEEFEVLKNFLSEAQCRNLLEPLKLQIEWLNFEYYWVLKLQNDRGVYA